MLPPIFIIRDWSQAVACSGLSGYFVQRNGACGETQHDGLGVRRMGHLSRETVRSRPGKHRAIAWLNNVSLVSLLAGCR
jgi:hypothetical protein